MVRSTSCRTEGVFSFEEERIPQPVVVATSPVYCLVVSHGRHTGDTSAENERGSARVRMAKSLAGSASLSDQAGFQRGSTTILDISNLSKSSSSMLCSPTMTEMEEKMASSTQ